MKKYRVHKLDNDNYIIQMKNEYTTGMLWWKKQVIEWVHVNQFGQAYLRFNRYIGWINLTSTTFTSKKKVYNIVKKLNKDDK
jgi:hypothetical protein